ncbi:MAG: dihydrodipicolinate synthase family protein [Phycisphaerales bacterium]|nr:dihydrodipicolinate synthase family protein [Phycisphaerales bacterium]
MTCLPTLDGLIAAAHTPFDSAGELALDRINDQAALFMEQNLIGVFVGGSTGEWFALSLDERRRLIDAWAEASGDSLTLIAHVGGVGVHDACTLAQHAAAIGLDAISCLVEPGAGVHSIDGVLGYLQPVAEAAGATPLFYYDMPSLTGIDVPLDELLETAMDALPTLAGAKYTNEDLATLTRAMTVGEGRCQMLMGRDEMLLGALAIGIRGAVGSTYNYAAPVYQRIRSAFDSGDMAAARAANVDAVMFVRELVRIGVLDGAKAIMGWMGVDVGRPRSNETGPSDGALAAFHDAVAQMDVFARPLSP